MKTLFAPAAFDTEGRSPDDLRERAKVLACDRKIMRLLDRVSTPPFTAALEVLRTLPSATVLDDVALYTISDWDPWLPVPVGVSPTHGTHEDIFRALTESNQPTAWLRGLANNTLCQVAIAGQLRGPNLHVVGEAAALEDLIVIAHAALVREKAPVALLVAFDTEPAERHLPPDEVDTQAAAVALTLPSRAPADSDAVLETGHLAASGARAYDTLRDWARTIGSGGAFVSVAEAVGRPDTSRVG